MHFPKLGSKLSGKNLGRREAVALDLLIAFAALGGLAFSALFHVKMYASDFAASDFKTLYASAWCFAHGWSAYDFASIQSVFRLNQIIFPPVWFGHAPVYPPTTLALLAPLTILPMVPAIYCMTILSAGLMAAAVASSMRYAQEEFSLPLWGRIGIAGLFAACPLLSFALNLGNISVAAAALSMLAFTRRRVGSPWLYSGCLAAAILLKPHVALWVAIAMLVLPERAGRRVAMRASALVAVFAAGTALVLAATGNLALQTRGFLSILHSESSAGESMSPSSREVLPVNSQIPSLHSIIGFWTGNSLILTIVGTVLLCALAVAIFSQAHRVASERGALLLVSACYSLGMLATYHRTHDAILLLILLPWAIDSVRSEPREWYVWASVALYAALCFGPSPASVAAWVGNPSTVPLVSFVLLRQAGLADLCLTFVFLFAMAHEHRRNAHAEALIHDTRYTDVEQTYAQV